MRKRRSAGTFVISVPFSIRYQFQAALSQGGKTRCPSPSEDHDSHVALLRGNHGSEYEGEISQSRMEQGSLSS